jgi:hypothetical protein
LLLLFPVLDSSVYIAIGKFVFRSPYIFWFKGF